MSPLLTYRPREGVVFGTVAGQAIQLTTLRNQAGMTMPQFDIGLLNNTDQESPTCDIPTASQPSKPHAFS